MADEGIIGIQRLARDTAGQLARMAFLGQVRSVEDDIAEMELLGPWTGQAIVPDVQLLTSDPRGGIDVAVGDTALCLRTADGVFAIAYVKAAP